MNQKKSKKQRRRAELERSKDRSVKQERAQAREASAGRAKEEVNQASTESVRPRSLTGSSRENSVILKVEDLQTEFPTPDGLVRAVRGVSFELRRGEILGIVGESGSGKSVTNLSLMGLVRAPGRVRATRLEFDGSPLDPSDERIMRGLRGSRIAMIFQDPMTCLNPFLSVGEQIAESLELHKGLTHQQAFDRSVSLLESVGISDAGRRVYEYPHQFSGGMRQRVMIAMALSCDPDVLIADEPTTALDVTIQAQIIDLIKRLRDERRMSVIFVTHDLGVVAGTCDRVLVMYGGRIVERNTTGNLFRTPGHPYTYALMNSIPRLDSKSKGELSVIEGMPPDLSGDVPGCAFAPRCDYREARCLKQRPELEAHGAGEKACFVSWRPRRS